jgi:hypothetical protein
MTNKDIEQLRPNKAGSMLLKNGHVVNYGVIRIDNEKVVYYTGKGLREMWKPNMTEKEKAEALKLKEILDEENGEAILIASEHIAITPLDQIERVNF